MIVDKPAGWTSHDVVARMRRLAGTRKVGHAGTLDPMATGVLVLGINKATRLLTYIVGETKTYTGTIRLGQGTVTDDAEGVVTAEADASAVTDDAVAAAVGRLTGDIEQVPSSVSAIKVNGQRSYARVRSGQEVALEARPVTVSRFDIDAIRRNWVGATDATDISDATDTADIAVLDVDVTVSCSSGTYIRALARDVGADLGVGGHLTALRRTRVGPFTLEGASTLDELADRLDVTDIDTAAGALLPSRTLSEDETRNLSFGRRIAATEHDHGQDAGHDEAPRTGPTAAFSPQGRLIALLQDSGPAAKPIIVFAPASKEPAAKDSAGRATEGKG